MYCVVSVCTSLLQGILYIVHCILFRIRVILSFVQKLVVWVYWKSQCTISFPHKGTQVGDRIRIVFYLEV